MDRMKEEEEEQEEKTLHGEPAFELLVKDDCQQGANENWSEAPEAGEH